MGLVGGGAAVLAALKYLGSHVTPSRVPYSRVDRADRGGGAAPGDAGVIIAL